MSLLKLAVPRWTKAPLRGATWRYRRATWRYRVLPDFILIGAQKCGTTSLFHYLGQHLQLAPSFGKEVHFFDGGLDPRVDNFAKGQAWYRAHFPLKKHMSAQNKTFEASPFYIFNPQAPKRIADLTPEVKLIAVLRNPTERAISHYFHEKRKQRDPLPIFEALLEEERRLDSVLQNEDYKHRVFIHHSYKSRGLYRKQLERYLEHFPPSQMLVLNSEKLFTEPDETLKRVFTFVGVDPGFMVKDLKPRNVASNRSQVEPEVYEYLTSYFRPHNQALYDLLGENFGW